jgi:transposase
MEWVKIQLSKKELEALEKAEKAIRIPNLLKRIQAVKLKNIRWKNKDIANFLQIRRETCGEWIKLYKNDGIDGLLRWDHQGRISVLNEDHQEKIKQRIGEQPFADVKEAKSFIEKEFGINFCSSWVQKLMKKNFKSHSRS